MMYFSMGSSYQQHQRVKKWDVSLHIIKVGFPVASKLRHNPVRQCNSSKPDMYRIELFVLIYATNGKNFIYHTEVYQGKRSNNVHIVEEAWSLPTSQKSVANAVVRSGISNVLFGEPELYMDNCYIIPDLFVLLRGKYHSYAAAPSV